jgi:hypothetical protein
MVNADPDTLLAARNELRDLLLRRVLGARASFRRVGQILRLTEEMCAQHPVHQLLEPLNYEVALDLFNAEDGTALFVALGEAMS